MGVKDNKTFIDNPMCASHPHPAAISPPSSAIVVDLRQCAVGKRYIYAVFLQSERPPSHEGRYSFSVTCDTVFVSDSVICLDGELLCMAGAYCG